MDALRRWQDAEGKVAIDGFVEDAKAEFEKVARGLMADLQRSRSRAQEDADSVSEILVQARLEGRSVSAKAEEQIIRAARQA